MTDDLLDYRLYHKIRYETRQKSIRARQPVVCAVIKKY